MQRLSRLANLGMAMCFGYSLSSIMVRLDHPEIGGIFYPLVICIAVSVPLSFRLSR